jgi:O-antigen/teichoic acid export membrane protein
VPLLKQASRAAFWNAVMLPVLSVLNLAFAVLIRRRFGLFSGVYDVLMGLMQAVLRYSALGIPTSLTKLLPDVGATRGASGLRKFLWRAALVRFVALGACVAALWLFRGPLVVHFKLGADGVLYLQLVTGLMIGRAVIELTAKVLNTFFAQIWTNGLALLQAVLDIALVAAALLLGYGMAGVLSALAMSAGVVAILSIGCAVVRVRRIDERGLKERQTALADAENALPARARFTLFTYIFELSLLFVGMGFAAPALAKVLTPADVALFGVAFRLSIMSVGLVVTGFRGLYRPLFARLRLRDDLGQLQHAFTVVTKAQLVLLLPAGVGLVIMCGDYIPLLFGVEFLPAVQIAWVLVAFMYAETAFNLPVIILSVDEQYRAVFVSQSVMVLAAPFFLLAAATVGLVGAGVVFGVARLASALCAYAYCRARYGIRFPWGFAGRVARVSLPMGGLLAFARLFVATSVFEAVALTLAGVITFAIGVRMTRMLTTEEADVFRRSSMPGHALMLNILAPHLSTVSTVATGADD